MLPANARDLVFGKTSALETPAGSNPFPVTSM
jgi:hypothetical protein